MDFYSFYEEYFPFWKVLTEEDRQFLCANSSMKKFDASQTIHDNIGCTGLYIVKSGKLRLYLLSEEGKEVTLYRLTPGELCMLSASCVLQSITFDVYMDAEMPSECYMINASAFNEISEKYLEAKNYALEIAVSRFSDVMWIMQQILFMSMDKRLAIFLMDEILSNDSDTVTMTHEQIARHLGTAREVVTRVLKHLAEDGIVEVTRKGIHIVDKKKLRDIAY